MTQLYRVLYCSRTVIPGPREAVLAHIADILAVSRRNNARDGITGGLLFSDGCFAQVLEGTLDAIEATFERIQCDERHGEVTVLQCGPIEQRDFAGWSMAFAGPAAQGEQNPGLGIDEAFAGQSADGDRLLGVLKGVIMREAEWLAVPGAAPGAVSGAGQDMAG